jgi:sugar transferase (PEP-CTERM system associated)
MLRIQRHFVPVSAVLLGLCDCGVVAGLISWHPLTMFLAGQTPIAPAGAIFALAMVAAGTVGTAMMALGLYSRATLADPRAILRRSLLAAPLIAALGIGGALAFQILVPLAAYLVPAAVWPAAAVAIRAAYRQVANGDRFKRKIIVVGSGTKADRLAGLMQRVPQGRSTRLVFAAGEVDRVRIAGGDRTAAIDLDPAGLTNLAARIGAQEIVVAADDRRGLPYRQLLDCRLAGIRVTDYLSFWERETGTVDLAALDPSWMIYSDGFHRGRSSRIGKRVFDIAVSLFLLVPALPVMLLVAAQLTLEGGEAVLYRQERVGLGGRRFMLLKFRSMRGDAEGGGQPLWAAQDDARITPIGAVLRKLHLDELPQLFNVLRGDMSLIGPRPQRPYFVERLAAAIPFYSERHSVKPGLTGWAQIRFGYAASIEETRQKLAYDLYYVKNQSLFLDCLIFLRTLGLLAAPTDGGSASAPLAAAVAAAAAGEGEGALGPGSMTSVGD